MVLVTSGRSKMKEKSLKYDFYLLVIKTVLLSLISGFIVFLSFAFFIYKGVAMPTDYYFKYMNEIENEIRTKKNDILNGKIIDLSNFSDKIKGEVIDPKGNHLYGDVGIAPRNIDYWKTFNRDFAKNQYIYRYIPIVINDKLEAIYVLKAPFGFIINNKEKNPVLAFFYIPAIISPLLFFGLYLFIFTRRLYLSIWKNISTLLDATEHVRNKNFDITVQGLRGKEFVVIQDAFNEMIKTLNLTLKTLWNLDDEKRKMLASIAHDIRTPITVIKGQMEIIESINGSDSLKESIQIVNNNCNRIINLVNNLALLGKIENTDFLIVKKEVHLYELLKEKEKELAMMANSKNIKVEFELNLKKEYYVLDENLLMRLIDNVLYNSLRFTSQGEIKLLVNDDGEKIHFTCLDTGKGFKLKDIDNLFKAYYQGDDFKGHFGLGLYIAKKIVDKFNGDIKAYNRKEGGAVVEFFIRELKNQVD